MPVQPVDYKIAILGPVPYDHITMWNNELLNRYGCIIYPCIALSKLFGRKARITPVAHVRKKDQQTVKAIMKGHPGIELLHINADFDQGDVMVLKFITKYKSLEKQYGFMNPIMPDDVKHLLDSDYFIVLPVTDYEVSLETLQFIKLYGQAQVIFDAHGATTAMTSLGDRVTKFWVDRDLWLPYIDVLTMTPEQAKYSWFAKEYTLEELEDSEDMTESDLQVLAEHCFSFGVKALYITLAEEGCLVFYQDGEKAVKEYVPSIKLDAPVMDTTGRGESFVAGLTYGLIAYDGDYIQGARFGNVISAQRTRGVTYDVFDERDEILRIVAETYGDK